MNARIWILVSDASKARLFQRQGPRVQELSDYVHPASSQHVDDLVSDHPGRRGMGRAGLGDRPGLDSALEPKKAEAMRFARQHAEMLKRALDDHRFDELVLVAPPHFLGLLRQVLDEQVAKRLTASFDRDYLELDVEALLERLQALT